MRASTTSASERPPPCWAGVHRARSIGAGVAAVRPWHYPVALPRRRPAGAVARRNSGKDSPIEGSMRARAAWLYASAAAI
jgi:hypothetical protein